MFQTKIFFGASFTSKTSAPLGGWGLPPPPPQKPREVGGPCGLGGLDTKKKFLYLKSVSNSGLFRKFLFFSEETVSDVGGWGGRLGFGGAPNGHPTRSLRQQPGPTIAGKSAQVQDALSVMLQEAHDQEFLTTRLSRKAFFKLIVLKHKNLMYAKYTDELYCSQFKRLARRQRSAAQRNLCILLPVLPVLVPVWAVLAALAILVQMARHGSLVLEFSQLPDYHRMPFPSSVRLQRQREGRSSCRGG